ncbi:hypothetical protein HPULCUR_000796 [Helicostylum pulchrum]|uniref:Major facilitator superfamily (MFS) profile domain-containing protein n=1 Tax=Helicostylum pulchrum TaxID=562976 RepID=A0ABP9XLW6_9FUNG
MTETGSKKNKTEVTPLLPERQRQGSWENDAKRVAKKPSACALYAPMIQFYTVVFCYRYYQSKTGEITDIPIENCTIPEVQAVISEAQAVIMFLTYASTLLVASYYGSLSDRKGRRLIFKLAGAGNCLLMVAYIATIKYQNFFGISLLFIAPVVRGLMAGDSVFFASVQAYITDCTTTAERTVTFGRFLGALYLGTTIGPIAASLLIKKSGTIMSIFYMVFIMSVIFELYVYLVLPESHDFNQFKPTIKKQESLLERLNIFSALRILFRTSSRHANRYALVIIAAISFLLAIIALPPTMLYAMLSFHWTAYEGGLYVSLASFARLIMLTLVLPFISKLFHKKSVSVDESDAVIQPAIITTEFLEQESTTTTTTTTTTEDPERSDEEIHRTILFDVWMIRFGLTVEMISLVVLGLVTTSVGFTLTGMSQSLAALAQPSLRSLTTTLVSANEIGELLGAMAVLESCASK